MDRFKFRVWDTYNKKYQGSSEEWQPYLDTDGDVCCVNSDDVRFYPPEDYFTVEQCTGLKDKNGNLIYEGDLLFDGEFCGVVVWKDSSWQVRFELYDGDSGYERLDQHFAKFGQIYGNTHKQKD